MQIALIADDQKKELLNQFCIAIIAEFCQSREYARQAERAKA